MSDVQVPSDAQRMLDLLKAAAREAGSGNLSSLAVVGVRRDGSIFDDEILGAAGAPWELVGACFAVAVGLVVQTILAVVTKPPSGVVSPEGTPI